MSRLDNPRHEQAAVGVALEGKTQVEAYGDAGFVPHDSNACRMIGTDRMQDRIGELQDEFRVEATQDAKQHLARLTAMAEKAMKNGQMSSAVHAEIHIGKVLGLYVERFKQEDAITDEQLLASLADLLPAKVLEELRIKMAG